MNDDTQDSLAPARPGRLPQRVGRRLAALGLVGGLMVALPLLQVLRYQNAELNVLMAERAGLDPTARAVDVQRGLLLHRDLAGLVLRGDSASEDERKLRQGEVDDRVAALAVALVSGQWERAVQESDALREDWSLLARQIGAHSLRADESEHAHRLLVEQVLQVIDLVADGSTPRAAQADTTQANLAVTRALPRLSWQLAALATLPTGADETWQRELVTTEAGLARTLGTLNTALAREPQPALAAAVAGAGAAADRYFHLLRQARRADGSAAAGADLPQAAQIVVRAQFALFTAAQNEAKDRLALELTAAEGQRNQWLIGAAALGLLLLGVVNSLVRSLRGLVRDDGPRNPTTPTDATRRASDRGEADSLLQRLRDGDDSALPRNAQRQRPEPQPTMPGEL